MSFLPRKVKAWLLRRLARRELEHYLAAISIRICRAPRLGLSMAAVIADIETEAPSLKRCRRKGKAAAKLAKQYGQAS